MQKLNPFIPTAQIFSAVNPKAISANEIKTIAEVVNLEDDPKKIEDFVYHLSPTLQREWCKWVDYWRKQRIIAAEFNGEIPTLSTEFVDLLAKKWEIDYYFNGLMWKKGRSYNRLQFGVDLRLENERLGLNFSDARILDAVDAYVAITKQKIENELIQRLQYDPAIDATSDWVKFENTCFNSPEPGFVIAVLKKTMHSVKRKLHYLPVERHLMAVLTGDQESGKSSTIDLMCEPIKEMITESNLVSVTDDRDFEKWENLIIKIPECAKANNTEIELLKSRITGKEHSGRPMRTNSTITVHNRSTLIADSNLPLDQILFDPTGMRRFAEILWKLPRHGDPAAFEIINQINWLNLWKSIDETGPDPIKPFKHLLERLQGDMTVKTPVELWLEDDHRDLNRKMFGEEYKSSTVWVKHKRTNNLFAENFKPWLDAHFPDYKTHVDRFSKQLNELYRQKAELYGLEQKKTNNKATWHINRVKS